MVESSKKYKIGILGATGAIGREVIRSAVKDDRVSEIGILARKPLEEWSAEEAKKKIKVVARPNFDDLSDTKDEFAGYDAFICTIGARVKVGAEEFKRVDYQYPLNFAKLGLECGVKHYGILTSVGAKSSSWFLYPRTKG